MQNPNNAQFVQYMQSLLAQAQNNGPQQVIQMLSQQYPQAMQQAQQMMNSGTSMKDAAMYVLRQRGIDPSILTGPKR